MVWDTSSTKVAAVDDKPAIGLSAETAKRFVDMLNSQEQYGPEGDPNNIG
jgi:hypothetical protein